MRLGFGGRDIADGFEQAAVVEPVDPFQRGVFDIFEGASRALPVDELGLVQTVDGFRQGVVVTVADAAHGWLDPGLDQAFGILDRDILAAAI